MQRSGRPSSIWCSQKSAYYLLGVPRDFSHPWSPAHYSASPACAKTYPGERRQGAQVPLRHASAGNIYMRSLHGCYFSIFLLVVSAFLRQLLWLSLLASGSPLSVSLYPQIFFPSVFYIGPHGLRTSSHYIARRY
jgi:hypothetical protein